MSRSAIRRRSVLAAGLVFIAVFALSFSAGTSSFPAKLLWRATGPGHALMASGNATSAHHRAVASGDPEVSMAPVPEPGVIASLIGGVALLLSLRRRHG